MSNIKQSLVMAILAAAIVGCSSNQQTDPAPVDPVDTTGQVDGADPIGAGDFPGAGEVDTIDDEAIVLDTVFYFEFDQAVLKPEARTALEGHAERLRTSGASVLLEGHTDERGTTEYNLALGERRAQAVRDFLILQGVNASSIEIVSYGEEKPADTGFGEAAMAANRRVEMK